MKESKSLFVFSLVLFLIATSACVPAPPSLDIQGIQERVISPTSRLVLPLSDKQVAGNWVSDYGFNNYPNTATHFLVQLDVNGRAHVDNVRLPATWNFTFGVGPCSGETIQEQIQDPHGFVKLICMPNFRGPHGFFISPETMDAQNPPSSFAISGGDISNTYGMPIVDFYDELGRYFTSVSATSFGIDETGTPWLVASMPSLPYTCTYAVVVTNILPNSTYDVLGGTVLQVTNGQELPLGCNFDEKTACENQGVGYYWDSDSCTCGYDPCTPWTSLCEVPY